MDVLHPLIWALFFLRNPSPGRRLFLDPSNSHSLDLALSSGPWTFCFVTGCLFSEKALFRASVNRNRLPLLGSWWVFPSPNAVFFFFFLRSRSSSFLASFCQQLTSIRGFGVAAAAMVFSDLERRRLPRREHLCLRTFVFHRKDELWCMSPIQTFPFCYKKSQFFAQPLPSRDRVRPWLVCELTPFAPVRQFPPSWFPGI